jgi:flagellar biosynthesis anti-sigma factor FlgM
MDIRSGLDGLKSLLGVSLPEPAVAARDNTSRSADNKTLGADHATLSSAGSEVAQAAVDGGVRANKVAAVQSALAAGTYRIPSSAVAAKVIDSMLGDDR